MVFHFWIDALSNFGGVERVWAEVGPRIRGLLQEGQRVLFHCRAGHGRSGMMAARLLIELGWSAESAISEVRRVRPGAIEGAAQQAAVRDWGSVTTMTKTREDSEGFSLRKMVEIADRLGHGDSQFANALRAGIEGKSPAGRPLAKGQGILIQGLPARVGILNTGIGILHRHRAGQPQRDPVGGGTDMNCCEFWGGRATAKLKGRKIVEARYLDDSEMQDMGWDRSALVLYLDDGQRLIASSDNKGNAPGALFTSYKDLQLIPVV